MKSKSFAGLNRVTDIIRAVSPDAGLEKAIQFSPGVVERAAQRGKCLHEIAGFILRCKPIPPGLIAAANFLDSRSDKWILDMKDFQTNAHWKVKKVALRMNNMKEKVTGELDFIVVDEFGTWIPDLKTSSKISKNAKPQLGGYLWLYGKPARAGILHAPMGKKPKFIPYLTVDCLGEWREILRKFKQRNKK